MRSEAQGLSLWGGDRGEAKSGNEIEQGQRKGVGLDQMGKGSWKKRGYLRTRVRMETERRAVGVAGRIGQGGGVAGGTGQGCG